MTVQTFPIANPSYNSRIESITNVRVIKFGDGFEQRLTEGLNQIALTAPLTFELTKTDGDTAIEFLKDRIIDGESFFYTLPNETTAKKFVCDKFPKSIPFLDRVRLTCVFREVFEP